MTIPSLEDAIRLAARAHQGQTYPSAPPEPYILHPLRVMLQMESDADRIVAVLHDVVEDTDTSLDQLRTLGFSDVIVDAIDCLTHRPDEAYDDYISRLAMNPRARRVNLADLDDNLTNNLRLPASPATHARVQRYRRAISFLRSERAQPGR